MIFTGYWEVLVLNFSVIENTVFFRPKGWWKDDIYLVFLSFPWYSKTWEIWFSAQCDLTKINNAICDFYANLFKEKLKTNSENLNNFLNDLSILSLAETQKQICEEELTENDIYESMISFDNNKPPGNDGLTKEFYQTFWQDLKDIFFNSLQKSKRLKYLCTSQHQAIIKLLEKPNKDKRYVSNWRLISLLNLDRKNISKALGIKLSCFN